MGLEVLQVPACVVAYLVDYCTAAHAEYYCFSSTPDGAWRRLLIKDFSLVARVLGIAELNLGCEPFVLDGYEGFFQLHAVHIRHYSDLCSAEHKEESCQSRCT